MTNSVRPRLINVRSLVPEITSRKYVTHAIDKYPAKMVPHLARYAILKTSQAGETVLDPFCGCGTVLVEATLTGRHSVGVDVNPVAVLLARSKVSNFSVRHFRHAANRVLQAASTMDEDLPHRDPTWLGYWFTRVTLRKLRRLRHQIELVDGISERQLLLTCLTVSVRPCSLADPRSPKPFISKRARLQRVGRHFDPYQIYGEVVEQVANASEELASLRPAEHVQSRAMAGDARFVTRRQVGRVHAVVTSPPYLTAQDYYRSSKLELAISGLWREGMERELGRQIIGSGRGGVPVLG